MIFSLSTMVNASTTLSYKVKAGDKQSYKLEKFNFLGITQSYSNITWNDGTTENVTIKQGMTFSVTVCSLEGTGDNQVVMGSMTLNGKTTDCTSVDASANSTSDTEFNFALVNKVADNSSYYQAFVDQNSTMYSLNGDIFTNKSTTTFLFDITTEISINIKTGWTTKESVTIGASGTELGSMVIAATSGSAPGFEFSTTIGLFAILVPVVLVYRKRKT